MAIKAIINNTEKEIEQIKNSNEQDIDYVYSRIGDTEIEGEPPISIKSIGGELANYRIYGNTVGGESVGDRTGNLFEAELVNYNVSANGQISALTDFILSIAPVIAGTTYTISNNQTTNVYAFYQQYPKPERYSYNSSRYMFNENSITIVAPIDGYIVVRKAASGPPIMLNSGSTALPYEPYGYKVPVTISNGTDMQTIPIYLPEQIKKVGDEAEYISYTDQKLHRIGADDIDVTLPALPTIKGTNTLSVNTSIQPSNIYIKDSFDYKKVFTATRAIENELPLNYKNIEDSDSTLSDYRIYGQTVDGESVGDLVTSGEHAGEYKVPVTVEGKNLLQNTATSQTTNGVTSIVNSDGSITCNGTATAITTFTINIGEIPNGIYIVSGCPNNGAYNTYRIDIRTSGNTTLKYNSEYVVDTGNGHLFDSTDAHSAVIRIENGYTCNNLTFYPMIRKADIEDDTYEPYHAPVTTPIYLPEQIRKVGDEAEYISYAEQKLHRVRKNLLQNTGASRTTINGVTFTINSDGSIVCDGQTSSSTATLIFSNFLVPSGTYILTGCPNGGTERKTYKMLLFINGAWFANDMGSGANFTLTKTSMVSVRIDIYNGYTCDNLTFYPMICKADMEDDTYEPYIENTDIDVTLPELPTLAGTNTLSIETEVKPSKITVKGHIK